MSYAVLKADIAALVNRDDLTVQIPGFIRSARGRLNAMLDHPDMEGYLQIITDTNGQALLPSDVLRIKNAETLGSGAGSIRFVHRNAFDGFRETTTSPELGTYATIQGRNFLTYPALQGITIEMRVKLALTEFNDDADTDWLLTSFPHLYVYGAAYFAHLYLQDEARAQAAEAVFVRGISEVNEQGIEIENPVFQEIFPNTEVV